MQFLFGIILFFAGYVWTKNNIKKYKKDRVNYIINSLFDLLTMQIIEILLAVIVMCLGVGLIFSSFS